MRYLVLKGSARTEVFESESLTAAYEWILGQFSQGFGFQFSILDTEKGLLLAVIGS